MRKAFFDDIKLARAKILVWCLSRAQLKADPTKRLKATNKNKTLKISLLESGNFRLAVWPSPVSHLHNLHPSKARAVISWKRRRQRYSHDALSYAWLIKFYTNMHIIKVSRRSLVSLNPIHAERSAAAAGAYARALLTKLDSASTQNDSPARCHMRADVWRNWFWPWRRLWPSRRDRPVGPSRNDPTFRRHCQPRRSLILSRHGVLDARGHRLAARLSIPRPLLGESRAARRVPRVQAPPPTRRPRHPRVLSRSSALLLFFHSKFSNFMASFVQHDCF
jgi:hypothetical protein